MNDLFWTVVYGTIYLAQAALWCRILYTGLKPRSAKEKAEQAEQSKRIYKILETGVIQYKRFISIFVPKNVQS